METNKSVFEILNAINVNEHTEKKNGLTYLSWAWAWQEVKKAFPSARYTIYENAQGIPYFTDGKTCWVKTGVTINDLEYIEYLPIMDYRNQSITVDKVTSMNMNTAIQRSLTKACARHGLGLYIYAGEDLPDEEQQAVKKSKATKASAAVVKTIEQMIADKENIPQAYINVQVQLNHCQTRTALKQLYKTLDTTTQKVFYDYITTKALNLPE